MSVKEKQFFKQKLAIRVTSSALVLGALLAIPLQAEAYYRIGRIWTSTVGQKYPTVLAGNFNTSMIQVSSSMNQKWGSLPNSTLKTGPVLVTSSSSTYQNSAFTMVFGDNWDLYMDTAPGITLTCAGCNWAHVSLSTKYIWSNRFEKATYLSGFWGYVDSSTVILHELGHSYGLDHPDADPNSEFTYEEISSVMYPTTSIKRIVTPDDASGIASMY
jgi:hypothetical protein